MAITIQSSPGTFASANKGLYHVVTSNNTTQNNFKYVFDVQVGGTTIATIKNFPDAGGYGIFDASEIIRQYFATGFISGNAGIVQNSSNFINIAYSISYGEEYGGVTFTNLTTSNHIAWNYVGDILETPFSNYQNRFLSNRDRLNAECGFGENFFITYFNSAGSNVTMTIQKLLKGGAVDGASVTTSGLGTSVVLLLNLGANNINNTLGQNFITSDTYAYQVTIGVDTIVISNVCNPKFNPINVVFLNANGGYESFAFRLASRQVKNIENNTFGRVEYQRVGGNMVNKSNNVIIGGNRSYGTITKLSYRVISDYISATDYSLGSELLSSPEVYFEINSIYYPVIFKSTNWVEKLQSADRMFNYELEFEIGIDQRSQIR